MPFLVKEKTLNKVIQVETAKIDPNPYQPRREFDDIDGLAQSISQNGILQPLTVRRIDDRFQLVAGEAAGNGVRPVYCGYNDGAQFRGNGAYRKHSAA